MNGQASLTSIAASVLLCAALSSTASSEPPKGHSDPSVTNKIKSYVIGKAQDFTKSQLEHYFPTVELDATWSDNNKPSYGVLLVAPLSDINNVKDTFFTQESLYRRGDRTTINLGLGYRRLELGDTLLLGVNGFYDHEFRYDHGRTSLGLEARTTAGEVNLNRYIALTGWHSAGDGYEEQALSGWDIEAGIPMPYFNWTKFYARKFFWSAVEGGEDLQGKDLSLQIQLPILPNLTIKAGRRDYSGSTAHEKHLMISYNIVGGNNSKKSQPWISKKAFSLSSMADHRYDKVRRENLIIKQRRASGFTVSVVGF